MNELFYISRDWQQLRYEMLKISGARCECCGITPREGALLTVDHIIPISHQPELALDASNLQVLCLPCNRGKSNRDRTDWRGDSAARERGLVHIYDAVFHAANQLSLDL